MLEIDQCLFFWRTYLDQHESQITDHQLKVITSTIKHLTEYKKLKGDTNARLPLVPRNATR